MTPPYTMLDQVLHSFGHLDKIPFLENILVLEELHFRDDLEIIYISVIFVSFFFFRLLQSFPAFRMIFLLQ